MQPFKIGDFTQYYNTKFYSESKPLLEQVVTLKDYEDQISALSQENFNLKIKIFILDERLYRQAKHFKDLEDLEEKNKQFEAMAAKLEKEINEKNNLLKYASVALELMEKIMHERERILSLKLLSLKKGIYRFKLDSSELNFNDIDSLDL